MKDASIHGILVQSPLPPHINDSRCRDYRPAKDVDGFHPLNVAKLVMDDPTGLSLARRWVAYASCRKRRHESRAQMHRGRPAAMIVGKTPCTFLMRRGKAETRQ